MKILVACEESQAVTIELRKLGHEAYSCDIEPCSGGHPEWHLQVDALELLKMKWDMIIAFPPCTYLSNAGACRLYPKKGQIDEERYQKGLQAKDFFLRFLKFQVEKGDILSNYGTNAQVACKGSEDAHEERLLGKVRTRSGGMPPRRPRAGHQREQDGALFRRQSLGRHPRRNAR